jgi:hypothetical protein
VPRCTATSPKLPNEERMSKRLCLAAFAGAMIGRFACRHDIEERAQRYPAAECVQPRARGGAVSCTACTDPPTFAPGCLIPEALGEPWIVDDLFGEATDLDARFPSARSEHVEGLVGVYAVEIHEDPLGLLDDRPPRDDAIDFLAGVVGLAVVRSWRGLGHTSEVRDL